jgi:V/A-type H+-transporting ATPase subunit I
MPVPASLADKPWGRAVAIVLNRRVRLPAALARLDAALQSLSWHRRSWLEALDRALANRLSQLEAMAWFYQTELTFLIDGWAPRDAVAGLWERLRRETGDRVVVDTTATQPADSARVPVALSNARWMAPFERLVRLISLPRYGTIDPTRSLAVGFPLLRDDRGRRAYGVILLAALGWVRRRWPAIPSRDPPSASGFGRVCGRSCSASLYGECFGTLGERWGSRPCWSIACTHSSLCSPRPRASAFSTSA